jgi:predicted metal-binding protein
MALMNNELPDSPRTLTRAKPSWEGELVLVCRRCQKDLRRGIDGRYTKLSDWLPGALKRAGARKAFTVIECGCFDLCPKQGVALMRASEANSAKPIRVYRGGENPEIVVEWLMKEGD